MRSFSFISRRQPSGVPLAALPTAGCDATRQMDLSSGTERLNTAGRAGNGIFLATPAKGVLRPRENLKLSLYSLTLSQATLAQSLAQRITARYPPVIANSPERVVSRERVEEILGAVFSSELQRGSRLGLVPRVMLGYALKRRLQETGYDDEFIDFATKTLRRRLSHLDA